jgi:glycosyltransferase involved in cell wall biosynthesis
MERWVGLLARHHQLEIFATQTAGFDDQFVAEALVRASTLGITLHLMAEGVPSSGNARFPRRVVRRSGAGTGTALTARHEHCPFDLILVEHSYAASWIFCWRHLHPKPVLVLEEHNIESNLLAAEAACSSSVPASCSPGEINSYRVFERKLWSSVDHILAVSPKEAEYIHSEVGTPVHWIPIAVPLEEPVTRRPDPATLLFVGHLGFAPNVQAVVGLASGVMPLVWRKIPEARLLLVGRTPAPEVLALQGSRLEVHHDVATVTQFLARATVAVQPLRFGTGLQLKTIEALSAGVPLVVSQRAASPWGIKDGQHALIADTPTEVADAVITLLRDPAKARRLARRGMDLASYFDVNRIDSNLLAFLNDTASCCGECAYSGEL